MDIAKKTDKLVAVKDRVTALLMNLIEDGYLPNEISTCFLGAYVRTLALSSTPEENIKEIFIELAKNESLSKVIKGVKRIRSELKQSK